jgi:hypothetical protein
VCGLIRNRRLTRASIVIAALAFLVLCSPALADETVQVCGSYANNVFTSGTVSGIPATGRCPTPSYNGGGFALFSSATTTRGQNSHWQTMAPAGLELVGATANQLLSTGINDNQDYGGGFYWAGGGRQTNDRTPSSVGMAFSSPSSYFGMQLLCGKGTCKAPAATDRRSVRALRSRDERPDVQLTEWALADVRMDPRLVAVRLVGGLAIRALLALREPQRAVNRHDNFRAGRLELASMRGLADQPDG